MNEQNHLLTLDEAAEKLAVSTRTIRRRIADGSIPAVKLGAARQSPIRVPQAELDAWVFADEDEAP